MGLFKKTRKPIIIAMPKKPSKPIFLIGKKLNARTLEKIISRLRAERNKRLKLSKGEKKLRLYPQDSISARFPRIEPEAVLYRLILKKFSKEHKLNQLEAKALGKLFMMSEIRIGRDNIIPIYEKAFWLLSLLKNSGRKKSGKILLDFRKEWSAAAQKMKASKQVLRQASLDFFATEEFNELNRYFLNALQNKSWMEFLIRVDAEANMQTLKELAFDKTILDELKVKALMRMAETELRAKELFKELF